ncbi:MAG: polysaccharide pyruvyl transferase family protein [Candidatus Delongbacteria bacterium]|jgi:hypothetical protein|nr:polysaccharide pyruvyl transferase family protein [Candidatus Delongbacteria bacterium]
MSIKIGILTLHRSINYGAYMQAYSLSTALNKDTGYDVEIIDYDTLKTHFLYLKKVFISRPFNLLSIYKRFIRYYVFKKSLKKLNLSDRTFIGNKYSNLFKYLDNNYDVIIVGSDVVWNWVARGLPNAYWLNYNFKPLLFSYAASIHGMDYSNITKIEKEFCKNSLDKFKFIGVRDTVTEDFIKFISKDLNPIHTCDPTLFLDIDNLNKNITILITRLKKKYKLDFDKPIVGLMTPNEEIGKITRDIFSPKYNIVSIYAENKYSDIYLYDLTPFEWAIIFSQFKITITQYFHGTIFSLKHLVPVISIDVWKHKNSKSSKMYDILKRLGLEECFIQLYDKDKFNVDSLNKLVDDLMNKHHKEKIKSALEFESESYKIFLKEIKDAIKGDF